MLLDWPEAVELRVLGAGRQHSRLATLLGLLLDSQGEAAGEEQQQQQAPGLYPDSTLSQLSRTLAPSTNTARDTPATHHRLAEILASVSFEQEQLAAPAWELFDDSQVYGEHVDVVHCAELTVPRQVASVLEQCQMPNTDSPGRELLISVPELHHLLAAELSAIQVGPVYALVCPANALVCLCSVACSCVYCYSGSCSRHPASADTGGDREHPAVRRAVERGAGERGRQAGAARQLETGDPHMHCAGVSREVHR